MMPAGNRKSKGAKRKQDEGCKQGRAAFSKHVLRSPSSNKSDYRPSTSDDDTEESVTDLDSSNNRKRRNRARMSVVALQHLYSDFLPPHLQLNQYAH